jgi:hypothetical protein
VVPWILIAGSLLLAALSSSSMSWQGFLMLWMVCGAVADLGFGSFARNKLLLEFREAATRRYSRSGGFWSRLFGGGPKDGSGSI